MKRSMVKFLFLFAIIFISVFMISGVEEINAAKKGDNTTTTDIKKYENIVFLGDSITDWYPIEEIFGNLPIVRSGVAGYKTTDILDRMDEMVYQYNPTKIFVLIGTNDLNTDDADNDEIVASIQKIFKEIKENRSMAELYYESIFPVNRNIKNSDARRRHNEDIEYINDKMKTFCEKNDITYIDLYNELTDEDNDFAEEYTKDGLHPSDLGYARISQILTKYIYKIK